MAVEDRPQGVGDVVDGIDVVELAGWRRECGGNSGSAFSGITWLRRVRRRGQGVSGSIRPRKGFPSVVPFHITIWPEAKSAQNSIGAVSASGRTAWVLIRVWNLLERRSMASLSGPGLPLRRVEAGEGEQPARRLPPGCRPPPPGLQPPFAQEPSSRRRAISPAFVGIDHVAVVGEPLSCSDLGAWASRFALVNRAALDRRIRRTARSAPPRGPERRRR